MSDAIIGSSSVKETLNIAVATVSWSSSPCNGRHDKLSAFACHLASTFMLNTVSVY